MASDTSLLQSSSSQDLSAFLLDTISLDEEMQTASDDLDMPMLSESSLGKRKALDISDDGRSKVKTLRTSASDDSSSHRDELSSFSLFWSDPDIPVVIAHSTNHQRVFDSRNLSWGVQWEIARIISKGSLQYSQIEIPELDKLTGPSSKAAPITARVLLEASAKANSCILASTEHGAAKVIENNNPDQAFAKEIAARAPWLELDTEEQLLPNDPYAGLGFSTEKPEWYGGKVIFRGHLKSTKQGFTVVLDRPELGPSCRIRRRFGSSNSIPIKISQSLILSKSDRIIEFFKHPFILNGRVFRAFFAKDNTVFLMKTNETTDGSTVFPTTNSDDGLSLLDFLKWYNPFEFNRNQTMGKWASRFALGLSNSVPGLCLEAADILHEDDILSEQRSDMTDGCGFIDKGSLQHLRRKYSWAAFPTAVQIRCQGLKGLLLLQPDDEKNNCERPRIWGRPSQVKIKYPLNLKQDPAMLVIDILRSAHLKTPGRISAQTIINLAENGVPHSTFVDLFRVGLREIVDGLTNWEGPDAMYQLWCNVARVGGVMSARRAREAGGEARAKGYSERDNGDMEMEDEDDLQFDSALHQRPAAWWTDQISGCPSSLEETVLVLLDSGFTPENCAVLRDKLKQVVRTSVNNYVQRYRIEVPMSCMAFVVPDPHGVLADDEIQVKSSHCDLKCGNGFDTDVILSSVLITRYPCALPSDVRKVKAVEKHELRHFTDVIVCPIKGVRRFLDYLAGGDYDGDKCLVIWDPKIVDQFTNADLKYSVEPAELAACFSGSNERVDDFLQRVHSESHTVQIREIQKYLLGALRDTSIVGQYSNFHDNATYSHGYSHPETILLAYKFTTCLDSAKTGLKIRPEVLTSDIKKFQVPRGPQWKETEENQKSKRNEMSLRRSDSLKTFIMDTIKGLGKRENDLQNQLIDRKFGDTRSSVADEDLIKPWLEMEAIADRVAAEEGNDRKKRDLKRIADHVQDMYTKHKLRRQGTGTLNDKGAAFTELDITARQDTLRKLSKEFFSMPGATELEFSERERARLLASYAYLYDSQQKRKWSRFPWDVAMRELCSIKSHRDGLSKTVTLDFYERFSLKMPSVHRA